MLPPIKSFKPRVISVTKPVKGPAMPIDVRWREGVRGRRITLKQAPRVVPQPLAVLADSHWSRAC